MIREAYYEESAACAKSVSEAKLYTVFKVVSIVFFVIAVIQLPFAFASISDSVILYSNPPEGETAITGTQLAFGIVTWLLFILLPLGTGILFFFLKKRFNQSYDYLFVEDELRVAKVYNGKKRKYLKTLKCDQMLKLGKCSADSFERTCAGMGKKQIVFLTPNRAPSENKDFYYILYSSSIEKTVYIVETRVQMIDYLVLAAGRNKWESR